MSDQQILKPITTCRLCGQKFCDRALDVPIIGEPVTAAAERFVSALAGHIMSKHREQAQKIIAGSKCLYGFLTLLHFESQDAALKQLAELIRYDIHQSTRKLVISDEHVSKAVASLNLEAEAAARTEALIRDLRDLLTDSGQYAPQKTAEQKAPVLV